MTLLPVQPERELLNGETYLPLSTNNYRFRLLRPDAIFLYSIDLSPRDEHIDRDPIGSAMKQVHAEMRAVFGHFVRCGNILFSKVTIAELPTQKWALDSYMADINPRAVTGNVIPVNHEEMAFAVEWQGRSSTLVLKLLGSAAEENTSEGSEALLQFINIILAHVQQDLGLRKLGNSANFFNPRAPINVLSFPVVVWPGYFASVNNFREGMQLRIDLAHKVVRKDTVLDFIRARGKAEALAELNDSLVMTLYGRRLLYRVKSVLFGESPQSTFERSPGHFVTYLQYYREQYDITITDPAQPLLEVCFRDRPAVRIVPELCSMTGFTQEMRRDRGFTTAITKVLKTSPGERQAEINTHALRLTAAASAAEWGFDIREAVETRGIRMLDVSVQMGDHQSLKVQNSSFSIRSHPLATSVPISRWKLFYVHSYEQDAQTLYQGMKNAGITFGIVVEKPTPVEVPNGYKSKLMTNFQNTLLYNCNEEDRFVLLLLPNSMESSYGELKKLLTTERPVPSQVVLVSTARKRNTSVYSKIVLQIVAKLGGELWRIELPKDVPKLTMVVGIDVCHPGRGHDKSVLGFCATMNPFFTRYWNKVVFQEPRLEVGKNLSPIFREAIDQFASVAGQKPQHIIIYRDGVAPGQYRALYSDELVSVLEEIKAYDRSWHPTLIIAVVNKRVNARFFTETHGNMPSGVVVEEGVVAPHYNFYMSSHVAGDGTLTPTHYNIIHDDSKMGSGALENLTHALCYDYYNWTGGIRVPAPCQYAHKLAYLVGKHTKTDVSKALEHFTYQL